VGRAPAPSEVTAEPQNRRSSVGRNLA
jgi:hypothetical protein